MASQRYGLGVSSIVKEWCVCKWWTRGYRGVRPTEAPAAAARTLPCACLPFSPGVVVCISSCFSLYQRSDLCWRVRAMPPGQQAAGAAVVREPAGLRAPVNASTIQASVAELNAVLQGKQAPR